MYIVFSFLHDYIEPPAIFDTQQVLKALNDVFLCAQASHHHLDLGAQRLPLTPGERRGWWHL